MEPLLESQLQMHGEEDDPIGGIPFHEKRLEKKRLNVRPRHRANFPCGATVQGMPKCRILNVTEQYLGRSLIFTGVSKGDQMKYKVIQVKDERSLRGSPASACVSLR
jgi:hypothetical protein